MSKLPAITFPKTADGVWTNHETGVRVERYGKGYRAFRPADVTTGYIGIKQEKRTLAEARDDAAYYVRNVAQRAIAEAVAEAVAERGTTDIDQAAGEDQVDTWLARHESTPATQWSRAEDARQADHAEALQIDKGYPSGQARAWRERVYSKAVELDAANVHMGNAHDALIDELHAEALRIRNERMVGYFNARVLEVGDIQLALDSVHMEALAEDSYRESEAALAVRAAEHADWVTQSIERAAKQEVADRACTACAGTGSHHFEFTSAEHQLRTSGDWGTEGLQWCGEKRDAEVHQPPAEWVPEREQTADDIVHYWPGAAPGPAEFVSDHSNCGVNIVTTPYTFGSSVWDEVTCGQCLTTQPPAVVVEFKSTAGFDPQMADGQLAEYVGLTERLSAGPVPPAPTDVDDDEAWTTYLAATTPTPCDDDAAKVLIEFGNPYAEQVELARDTFRQAARNIWRARAAGTLTDQTYRIQRSVMGTAKMCIDTYRDLARSWAYRTLAEADRTNA